jgi:PAS domain S-box-containing protein
MVFARASMLSNSQLKNPKFALCLSLLMAGLCLSITSHASTLQEWRDDIASTRILAENNVPLALQEAQRLQTNIPADATPVDQVRVLNLLSRIEMVMTLTDQAVKHAQQAMELAKHNGNREGQAEADINIALNPINKVKIDDQFASPINALDVLHEIDRPDLVVEAMLRVIMMDQGTAHAVESANMGMQAMEIARRSNSPLVMAYAYQGLAISYELRERAKEAREQYLLMLQQAKAIPSKILESDALFGLAGLAINHGDIHSGERLVREALTLCRSVDGPVFTAGRITVLANNLLLHNHPAVALSYFDEAVATNEQFGNKIGLWLTLNLRSQAHQALHHLAAAGIDAERSYKLAKDLGLPAIRIASANRLISVASDRGDYRQASLFYIEATDVATRVERERVITRMVTLAKRNLSEIEQQKRIDELTRHNEQQDNFQRWLWTLLIGSFISLSITLYFLLRLRRSREDVRSLNIGLEQRVQERTAELITSNHFLDSVIDSVSDPIFVKDRQHRWTLLNDAFCEFLGHPREILLGKSDYDFFPKEQADVFWEKDELVFNSGKVNLNEEFFTTENGQKYYIQTKKTPFVSGDGRPMLVGVIWDITDNKRNEAAREDALVEAKRLAQARSEFLAQMSHELRTPLNGILGYAQILGRDKQLSERQHAGVRVIQQSGEHLLTLINDILDFAKIDSGKMNLVQTDFLLYKFLHAIAGIMRVKADQKRLEFSCSFAPDLPAWIHADEKRLRQVLLNLLSNAIKYTERGSVSLRVDCIRPDCLRFEVHDTGLGISPDQFEIIFQAFEQVAEKRHQFGGTGLGLPISRKFARLMGSDIHVESKLGQGSVFWFEIGVAFGGSDESVVLLEQVVSGYAGARKTILVVDDVQANRDILVEMLSRIGFSTIEADNGSAGLGKAQAQHPDLILMDTIMPVMDGLEATRCLRRLPDCKDIPIITISASASSEDQSESNAAGANDFIPKPLDLIRLLAKIGRLLKLDWNYESEKTDVNTNEPLIAPPVQEIEVLHHLALSGSVREILQQTDRLIEMNESYRPFAEHLRTMAAGYETKAILSFIEQYLERKSEA